MRLNFAVMAVFTVFAGHAVAWAEKSAVVTLNELSEPGQIVQLEAAGGACRYYGQLDDQGSTVLIEKKACPDVDRRIIESPYSAKANVRSLPAAIGTRLELIMESSNVEQE